MEAEHLIRATTIAARAFWTGFALGKLESGTATVDDLRLIDSAFIDPIRGGAE